MQPPYGTCPECGWQGRDWGFKYHSACKQCLRQWEANHGKKPKDGPPIEPTFEDFGISEGQYREVRGKIEKLNLISSTSDFFALWFTLTCILIGPLGAALHHYAGLGGPFLVCCIIAITVHYFIHSHASRDKTVTRTGLLQTIRPYEEAIRTYKRDLLRYNLTCEEYWKSLRGTDLEDEVAEVYRKNGYQVQITKATGDEGIDLVLEKPGWTGLVQCKGHKRPVGVGAARDLYGTLMHQKADRAILVCPAGFTQGVIAFAEGKPIDLVSASELMQLANEQFVEAMSV